MEIMLSVPNLSVVLQGEDMVNFKANTFCCYCFYRILQHSTANVVIVVVAFVVVIGGGGASIVVGIILTADVVVVDATSTVATDVGAIFFIVAVVFFSVAVIVVVAKHIVYDSHTLFVFAIVHFQQELKAEQRVQKTHIFPQLIKGMHIHRYGNYGHRTLLK